MNQLCAIGRISRWSSSGIWIFQGLVPKWLGPHADELAMSSVLQLPDVSPLLVSRAGGTLEILFGVFLLTARTRAWPHLLSAGASLALLAFVAIWAPAFLGAAFNPVTLNLALFALSLIAAIVARSEAGRTH